MQYYVHTGEEQKILQTFRGNSIVNHISWFCCS